MGKIAGKIFFTSKKHHSNQSPAASSRCLQGTPDTLQTKSTFTPSKMGLAAHLPYIYSFLLQQVEISALSESADD
ncbi:TPA: hypothetical protein JS183_000862 [Escherichia coli]|nr:hypothetical protein [Escherichia coli]HAX9727925.1 hypothetical protein [Escherichia coli]